MTYAILRALRQVISMFAGQEDEEGGLLISGETRYRWRKSEARPKGETHAASSPTAERTWLTRTNNGTRTADVHQERWSCLPNRAARQGLPAPHHARRALQSCPRMCGVHYSPARRRWTKAVIVTGQHQ